MAIGSFTFLADPNDSTMCNDKCPHIMFGLYGDETQEQCATVFCCIFDAQLTRPPEYKTFKRLLRCRRAEKHEAERAGIDALAEVRNLITQNGCDCPCEHHHEEHDDDCYRCIACRIAEVLMRGKEAPKETRLMTELPDTCPNCGKRMVQDGET